MKRKTSPRISLLNVRMVHFATDEKFVPMLRAFEPDLGLIDFMSDGPKAICVRYRLVGVRTIGSFRICDPHELESSRSSSKECDYLDRGTQKRCSICRDRIEGSCFSGSLERCRFVALEILSFEDRLWQHLLSTNGSLDVGSQRSRVSSTSFANLAGCNRIVQTSAISLNRLIVDRVVAAAGVLEKEKMLIERSRS